MTNTLSLFADSVNAYRGGDQNEIDAVNALWDATVPPVAYDPDMAYEGVEDYEVPDLSDREYDLVADRYERNWV